MGLFGNKKREAAGVKGAGREVTLPDGSKVAIAREEDCIGFSCPRPQLTTKKAIGAVRPGEVIAVLIDNPTSVEAIAPMCPELNATHIITIKAARHWEVLVRRN